MVLGINHITLAVSDLERSLWFYREILGFVARVKWRNGAYLSAGSLWLCLSLDEPCSKDDYTHVAFDVTERDFQTFTQRVRSAGATVWKENKSEGNSLYILDPDGHKLELHSGSLESRLNSLKEQPYSDLVWL